MARWLIKNWSFTYLWQEKQDTDRSIVIFVKRILIFIVCRNICMFEWVWKLSDNYRLIQFVNAWKHKSHCFRISAEISPLEDLSNLIPFMAILTSTNVTYCKENLVIFLNLFLIILILAWLWNFRTMLSIISSLLAELLTFLGI